MGATAKFGQGKALAKKWIATKGDNLVRCVDTIEDQTQKDLQQIQSTGQLKDTKTLKDLKKRKLVEKQ